MRPDLKQLVSEVLAFDRKKVVLPAAMVFVLLVSVLYGLHLRDAQGWDEEVTGVSSSVTANLTVVELEREYYPDISGVDDRSTLERRKTFIIGKSDPGFNNIERAVLTPSMIALSTDIYPLTPGSLLDDAYFNDKSTSVVFPFSAGYVASEEQVAALVENVYINRELDELEQRVNSSNITYSEFQSEVDRIRSVDYFDPEFRQMLFADGVPDQLKGLPDGAKDNVRDDDWTELQIFHFLPSFIATFAVYYLLSGIVLTGYRRFKHRDEVSGLDDDFFDDSGDLFEDEDFESLINRKIPLAVDITKMPD